MSRPAIAAVRRVLASLARPLPEYQVTVERLLTDRLPLEDVSPFDFLPDAAEPERVEGAVEAARAREVARAAASARTGANVEAGRAPHRETVTPAFSFRRPGTANRTGERGTAPVSSGVPALDRTERESINAPRAARPANVRAGAAEIARSGTEASSLPGPAAKGGASAGAPIIERSRMQRTSSEPFRSEYAKGATSAALGSQASEGYPLVTRTAKANVAGAPVMALVAAMADEILAAERKAVETTQSGPELTTPRPAPEVQMAEPTGAEARVFGPSTQQRSVPLHPEQLADLVNEVLAEQARRHGVDLS